MHERMLSEEIRNRLSQLHARPRGADDTLAAGFATEREPAEPARFLANSQECETASGKHLRLRRPLAELWPSADAQSDRRAAGLASSHFELASVAEHFPTSTLFLDLETCGFAGSPVFLAGLVWH